MNALLSEARLTHSSALVLLRGGEVLLDEVLDGLGDRPIETMSVTKAVLSLLVGRAVTLGHLPGADVRVCELYPEWRQGRKQDVTLRHLMTHTSGLQNLRSTTPEIYPAPDAVQLALCAELEHAPGTRLAYNNKAVNLICGVLERATGQKADGFARAHLFGPLGIEDWHWTRDRAGNPYGMSGLHLHARDLARLGQLALRGGEGLVSAEWIRESTTPASTVSAEVGLLWWLEYAWTHHDVTSEHVAHLRAAGDTANADALAQAHGLWTSWPALHARLTGAGFDRQALPEGVRWMDVRTGPPVAFGHTGDLGQSLLIVPDADLVAVRLIDHRHPQSGQAGRAFPEFNERVLALAGVSSGRE